MPTYTYRCDTCEHQFDAFQRFSDASLTECPECGAPIRRVIQPVGIVFKGSGWYINDSRAPEKDSAKAGASPVKDGAAPAKDGAAAPDSTPKAAPATSESSTAAAAATAKAAAD